MCQSNPSANTRARPRAQSILTGQPHPPISEKSVREAEQWYAALQRGELPRTRFVTAMITIGKAAYTPAIPLLEDLLDDPDEGVRRYALQALVLDFHLPRHCETAWRMLEEETESEVRSMAAACLGFCYTATRDLPVLQWMADIVADDEDDESVRVLACDAIFDILGYPYLHPKRPGIGRADFRAAVDWELIAQIKRGAVPPTPDE